MIECSHRGQKSNAMTCRLAPGLMLAPLGTPNNICTQCHSEWVNGIEPTKPTNAIQQAITPQIQHKPTGLGDTIAHITHATGLDKLAELYTKVTGKDCGCKGRQEALNKMVPYKSQQRPPNL